jgi:hypothetical protein
MMHWGIETCRNFFVASIKYIVCWLCCKYMNNERYTVSKLVLVISHGSPRYSDHVQVQLNLFLCPPPPKKEIKLTSDKSQISIDREQKRIHFAVCLTTGPQPFPKRVLHRVRSSASFFNFQYPLFSLRSSSSCWRLVHLLPVHSNFPPILCFRRQFLCKLWPIQLAFCLFTVCMIFLSCLTLCNAYSFLTRSVQMIFSFLLQHHIWTASVV